MTQPALSPMLSDSASLALNAQRERTITLLIALNTALSEVGEGTAQDRARINEVVQDLRDQFFMVAVIGEFNAGKSSFINALLGADLLAIGITPTTEAIHLIRYGETAVRPTTPRPDGIFEWQHPNTGAPGVALVDTPGTGSVFQRHEETAKAFLHRSDLVIFVISAKRAFAETERLYLSLARDFGKKIILVINQVDLLEPNERGQVRRFVERQAEELLGLKPLIFMVSAKEALKGTRADEDDPHGIGAVRQHLHGLFQQTSPAQMKLKAQLDTADRVLARQRAAVQQNLDLISADRVKVEDIQRELGEQSTGLSSQLKIARTQVDTVFEAMRLRGMNFINSNLSLGNLARPQTTEALQQRFQDEVVSTALRDVSEAASNYINAVVDNSRGYWRGVIDRLNQMQRLMEQELPGLDASIYAEQRVALQEAVRLAETELRHYSTGRIATDMQDIFQRNLNGLAVSGGAALLGALAFILGLATPGGVFTAAASVLVAPAVLIGAPVAVAGAFVGIRYLRRITRDAKAEMNTRIAGLVATYHTALDDLTSKERARLAEYGTRVLTPIFSRLGGLADRYRRQIEAMNSLEATLNALRREIDSASA